MAKTYQQVSIREDDAALAGAPVKPRPTPAYPRYRVPVQEYVTFHERGYLVVRGLLPDEDVAQLREHTEGLLGGEIQVPGLELPPPEATPAELERRYLRIHMLHRVQEIHERFLLHPRILDVVEALAGPDVMAMQTMLLLKPPGGEGQGYHQDSYYIPTYPDPGTMTHDDPKVYDLMCKADTVGVFQVESRAQMNTLPRFRPRTFYELAIEIALIRPGHHIVRNVPSIIERARNRQDITYPHPLLEPVLQRTYGLFIFQEQVMQASRIIADFSLREADELRQTIANDRFDERRKRLLQKFVRKARTKGVSEQGIREILHQFRGFATFGFPESHSLAFAELAYRSTWLKVYYPEIFYCALLNAQPMGFYAPSSLVQDAKRHGIVMESPDINRSHWDCTIEKPSREGKGGTVRLGLQYVKGIGTVDQEKLDKERERGPYQSLADFVRRTRLSRDTLMNLAAAGAFGSLGYERRPALWEVEEAIRQAYGELPDYTSKTPVQLPAMTTWDEARADYKITGISTKHQITEFVREQLTHMEAVPIVELREKPRSLIVKVGGLRTHIQRPDTAKGWVYLALEDETGILNVSVPEKLFPRYRSVILNHIMLMVEGRLDKQDGAINVVLKHVISIEPFTFEHTPKSRNFR